MHMPKRPLAPSCNGDRVLDVQDNPSLTFPPPCSSRGKDASEHGFVLLAVLFLVALLLIGLAVAAPRVAQDIQRDRETELYHRGMQYERAIRLYYRKTGNYPTDLSQLENTNNIRFLRQRYLDPITGKAFRVIHQGEAKVPLVGLFGQPVVGGQVPGAASIGTPAGSPIGGSTSLNGATTGSSLFSSSSSSSSQSPTPTGDTTGDAGTSGTPGQAGSTGTSGTTTGFGSTGSTGSTTVVGRIVGVSSTSPKASIRVFKKQTHYNQWEFVYDPASELLLAGGGQPNLNGPGGTTNPQGTGGLGTQPTQPTTAAPTTPTAPSQ